MSHPKLLDTSFADSSNNSRGVLDKPMADSNDTSRTLLNKPSAESNTISRPPSSQQSSTQPFADSRTTLQSPTPQLLSSTDPSFTDLNLGSEFVSSLPGDLALRKGIKDLEIGHEDDTLPPLRRLSWLRYVMLSCYRRLFSLVALSNLAAFIYIVTRNNRLPNLVNAAVANVLALGLARQPLVVNTLFIIFGAVPRSAPLLLRRLCAKIYCYGGVHSGCGIASFVWYVGFIGLMTRQYVTKDSSSKPQNQVPVTPAVMVLSYMILVLLLAIIVAAYPAIRMKMHDHFELTHRFCGWATIALFWPLLVLFSIEAAHANGQALGHFLITFPSFWMVIISTLSIIQPWLLLRRVPVVAEPLSSHAIRLHFDHTTINFGQGLSLAKHPLKDWHSFATFPDIPSAPGTNGTTRESPHFSCLISKAGDWTTATISSPPTSLYKRSVPAYGFGYVMKVFHRMILVTTGSGIGPCLSYLGDPNRPAMRVIWQTRTPTKTYGTAVVDLVHRMDPDPVILDTCVVGRRVDMLPMILRLVKEFNAEAVCVISNPGTTRRLVFECEARGVPAFGPIFDS